MGLSYRLILLLWISLLSVLWAAEFHLFRNLLTPGFIVSGIEVLFALAAAVKVLTLTGTTRREHFSKLFLALFLLVIAFADAVYAVIFYHLHWEIGTTASALLGTLPYSIAYLACAVSLLFACNSGLRIFASWHSTLLPLALSIPVSIRFLVPALISAHAESGHSVDFYADVFNTLASFILINTSLGALLRTRSRFWSLFAAAATSLVLNNWGTTTEMLLGRAAQFGFFDFFWAGAVLLASFAVLFGKRPELSFEPVEGFSLLSQYRNVIISIVCISLLAATLLQSGEAAQHSAVKTLSMGTALACLLAVLISQYFSEKVTFFAAEMGTAVKRAASKELGQKELAHFPMELREHFQAIFASELESQRAKKEADERLNRLAAQVAHDIRSPLAALELALKDLSTLAEDRRVMIRSAVLRIRDIANHLLNRSRPTPDALLDRHLISSLVDSMITEKRLQYRAQLGIRIEAELGAESYGLFAQVDPVAFKRLISNLVDNAAEALPGRGTVSVTLKSRDRDILLTIRDDGQGIAPEILPQLMKLGATFGKPGGSGLGLHHARTAVESWGGTISIHSPPEATDKGTEIRITFPRVSPPTWFVPEIRLTPRSRVVILDDDNSSHQIWQERLESLHMGTRVQHFTTSPEFLKWYHAEGHQSSETLFLIDHDLIGSPDTGLAIVEKLQIQKKCMLITSYDDDLQVKLECQRIGLRIIPKSMAPFLPLSIQNPQVRVDAVLIDDDLLIHTIWQISADRSGKSLLTFAHPDEFFEKLDALDRTVPIYIDSNLGPGLRGEVIAERIYQEGFQSVYLCTGHEARAFPAMPWIRKILGKDPPDWS